MRRSFLVVPIWGAIVAILAACRGSSAPAEHTSSFDGLLPAHKTVGYYVASKRSQLPASDIDWSHLTHIAHAFASPKAGGGLANTASFVDPDLIKEAHAHGVRVVASVGGASGDFTSVATSPEARAITGNGLAALCRDEGYDGIDVDWEFPDSTSAASWSAFLDELRVALDAVHPGLSLSAALSASPAKIDVLSVDALAKLDWIGALTYAYGGPTSKTVAYLSPLAGPKLSIATTIDHLLARGVSPDRVLVGLPFYGYEFKDGPPGTPVSSSSAVVEWDYRDIAPVIGNPWKRGWDSDAQVPYLRNGQSFLTYEDEASIDATCAFAASRGLAGALVWQLAAGTLADRSEPLLARAQACY